MTTLTPTAACVLGLLELGPVPGSRPADAHGGMTGWELFETASDSLARFWNVTRSQIYLELGRLEAAGLVEATAGDAPRARRPFTITEAGRSAFRAWLADWASQEPRDDQLHSPLLLTIFFGEYLPRPALRRVVEEYRLRYERRLERAKRIESYIGAEDRQAPPTAVLRRGLRYYQLMVDWLAETLAAWEDA